MSSLANSIDSFLAILPGEQKAIAAKLHKILMSINPDYETKSAWGGFGYKLGKNYSCLITSYADHLKLMIWRGVDLDDPTEVLEGKGVNTKHIKYFTPKNAKKPVLKSLLEQQFELYDSGVKYEG